MSAPSRKRKLGDGDKFYAVRAGKKPGVYLTWKECQDNITGFKGAAYKSFDNRKDAQDFCAGKNPAGISDMKHEGEKFYAVAVGKMPGIYSTWTECQEQIQDVKGPKFKKFDTRKAAEEFVKAKGKSAGPASGASKSSKSTAQSLLLEDDGPSAKKVKVISGKAASKGRLLTVYTDGSARGNGQVGATAGVGVYFGDNDARNVSEALRGSLQTNQRAELTAILRALEIVPQDRDMEIVTDSKYSIDCLTKWARNWMQKGWKTREGADVKNFDLIAPALQLMDARTEKGSETTLTHIRGHTGDPGNEAADRLAVAGSYKAF